MPLATFSSTCVWLPSGRKATRLAIIARTPAAMPGAIRRLDAACARAMISPSGHPHCVATPAFNRHHRLETHRLTLDVSNLRIIFNQYDRCLPPHPNFLLSRAPHPLLKAGRCNAGPACLPWTRQTPVDMPVRFSPQVKVLVAGRAHRRRMRCSRGVGPQQDQVCASTTRPTTR
jgi:hypothetical protein